LIDQKKAYLYAMCAVLIWSTIASAFKISLRYLEPIHLLLYSGVFAILFLGLLLVKQGKFSTGLIQPRFQISKLRICRFLARITRLAG